MIQLHEISLFRLKMLYGAVYQFQIFQIFNFVCAYVCGLKMVAALWASFLRWKNLFRKVSFTPFLKTVRLWINVISSVCFIGGFPMQNAVSPALTHCHVYCPRGLQLSQWCIVSFSPYTCVQNTCKFICSNPTVNTLGEDRYGIIS